MLFPLLPAKLFTFCHCPVMFSPFVPTSAASLSAHSLPLSFSHIELFPHAGCTSQGVGCSALTARSCLSYVLLLLPASDQLPGETRFQPAGGWTGTGAGRQPATSFQGWHQERRAAFPGGRLFPAEDSSSRIRAVGWYFPGQKPRCLEQPGS